MHEVTLLWRQSMHTWTSVRVCAGQTRADLAEREEPANEGPARDNVGLEYLIGRMDDAAHKPHQLGDNEQTLRGGQVLWAGDMEERRERR